MVKLFNCVFIQYSMSYPTIAEISLNKLKNNALKVKKLLGRKTKFYAVVKSNAYGHGIVEVSNALYQIADGFCVSLLSEALKLRISGIDKDILMLTPPFKETAIDLVRYDITTAVSSLDEIKLIENSAISLNKIAKVQLAINTGMNRLGFSDKKSILTVLNHLKNSKNLTLTGAFSHFGNVLNKNYTERQFVKFTSLLKIIKQYYPKIDVHISSSGGVLLGKKYHLNACRVGLLLYGYKPFKTDKISVEPIMKVYAKRILVRKNLKGKNLMYGDTTSPYERATILRLGYADGVLRRGLNDTINNLCMDISAIKGCKREDLIPVMTDAEMLSKKWKTIPYEVLVNITTRAEMRYKD